MISDNNQSYNQDENVKMNWIQASSEFSKLGQSYVLVTILGVAGSTPRNSGTKMVVTANSSFDTIGGGHLEHKAIKHAKALLQTADKTNQNSQQIEHFNLGSQLGQCCGGSASLLFECFAANTINIVLFGAGHVGQALIPILAGLPCKVTWVDNREEQFPANVAQYHNVTKLLSENPEEEVKHFPANSLYIVMTHNHQLDFDISFEIVKREDFHYLGLIASDTKWRRFNQRFTHREVSQDVIDRINCPIGLSQVPGKLPMEVAISVAGEIVQNYQSLLPQITKGAHSTANGVHSKEVKSLIAQAQQKATVL